MPEKVKGSLILHASLYKNVRLAFVALSIDPTVRGNRRIIDFFFSSRVYLLYYCIQEVHGVSCGSSLGVVTAACLLCARVALDLVQGDPEAAGKHDGETCAPSYVTTL